MNTIASSAATFASSSAATSAASSDFVCVSVSDLHACSKGGERAARVVKSWTRLHALTDLYRTRREGGVEAPPLEPGGIEARWDRRQVGSVPGGMEARWDRRQVGSVRV